MSGQLNPYNEGLRLEVGKYIGLPDNSSIVLDTFTVECWLYAQTRVVIVSRDRPGNAQPDWSIVYEANGQRIEFMTGMNSSPDSYFWTPNGSFPRNVWNHLAVVVNGPAGTLRIYINGSLASTHHFAPRAFTVQTGLAWGGYYGNPGGSTGQGLLDEAKYWSCERSGSQISASMNIAQPLHDRVKLHGYWRFCGNFADSSGMGNHCTPFNGAQIVRVTNLPFNLNCENDPCATVAPVSITPSATTFCEGDSVNLAATPGFVRYRWSNRDTNRSTWIRNGGTVSVEVVDSNGCKNIAVLWLTMNPRPEIDAGKDSILCHAGDSITIGGLPTKGSPPFSYSWSPPEGLSSANSPTPRAAPSSTTVYRLRVTDANGCTYMDSVRITVGREMWPLLPDTISVCERNSVQLPLQVAGGVPPFTFLWSPPEHISSVIEQNPYVSPPTSRMYYVSIRDAGGCDAIDSVFVLVNQAPDVTVTGDTVICAGASVWLDAIVRGGSPPYTYSWSPASGLSSTGNRSTTARPSSSTVYRIKVTDRFGCSAEDSVLITVLPPLLPILPDVLTICEGDSISLPLEVYGGDGVYRYFWEPSSLVDSPGKKQPRCYPGIPTVFRVTITDSSGCTVSDSVLVQISAAPELLLPDTLFVCSGKAVTLPLMVNSPSAPWTFDWTPPVDLSSTTVQQPQASPKAPRLYRVRVVDKFGCDAIDSVYVGIYETDTLTLAALGPTRFCDLDSVRLRATPGYQSYRWMLPTGPHTSTSNELVAHSEGVYRVAVVDSNGCELVSNPIYLTRPAPFPLQILPARGLPLCEGDSVTLSLAGEYTSYVWRSPDGVIIGTRKTVLATSAGRYSVTVLDSMGCPGYGELNVTYGSKPRPTIDGLRTVCLNSTHRYVSLLKPYHSYAWSVASGKLLDAGTGASTTIHWTTLGYQRLTLRQTIDTTGCADSITIVVHVIDRLDVRIDPQGPVMLCDGDSLVLRTAGNYAAYSWLNASLDTVSTDRQAAVRSGGRYILHATSVDGCRGSDTVDVTVLPRPSISIIGPRVFCAGDTAEYSLAGSGSRIRWTTTGGEILGPDTASTTRVLWRFPGSGTLRVRVEIDGQPIPCPAEDEIEIRIGSATPPWVIAQPDSVLCEGDSATLIAQPGFAEYRWRRADGTVLGDGASIHVGETGLYYVTVRDSLGCEASSAMTSIVVKDRPATEFTGPRSVCVNTVAEYCVTRVATSRYRWVCVGGTPVGSLEGPCVQIQWTAAGTHKLLLSISDDPCDWADSAEVVVGDSLKPDLSLQGPFTRCEGDSLILDAGAGYTSYLWSTPYGTMTTRSILAYRSGRYVVRVTDTGGCGGSSDPVEVLLHPGPSPLIAGPSGMCPGDSITLHVVGSYRSCRWSDASTGSSTLVGSSGTYRVEVVDSNGCVGISPPHVVSLYPVPYKPRITRRSDSLISTTADRYQWYHEGAAITGAEALSCLIHGRGNYHVRTWNAFGCWSDSDPFLVEAPSVIVMLPEITVKPGERVQIPLTLIHGGQLDGMNAGAFDATIRLDRMVVHLETDVLVRFDGRDMLVDVSGTHQDGGNVLTTLDVTATLGDVASTPLTIEAFRWLDSDISTQLVHGSLRLELCEEGGERLFSSNGTLRLYQNHPNPFNAQTVIRYALIEQGAVSLFVIDGLGRRVVTLFEGEATPGSYLAIFDATVLPTGVYYSVLKTQSGYLQRPMLIAK